MITDEQLAGIAPLPLRQPGEVPQPEDHVLWIVAGTVSAPVIVMDSEWHTVSAFVRPLPDDPTIDSLSNAVTSPVILSGGRPLAGAPQLATRA